MSGVSIMFEHAKACSFGQVVQPSVAIILTTCMFRQGMHAGVSRYAVHGSQIDAHMGRQP